MNITQIENAEIRAQVAEEIRRLKARARLADMMNDASIDHVLAIDTEMRIIAWNKTCEDIWGLTRENVLGQKITEVLLEINDCEAIMEGIRTALNGFKVFVPSDKGSYGGGYFENHFIPLRDKDDSIIGVLNIIHDVAHRIKTENELKQLNKSLARKNKELKSKNAELLSFSHVTSHDLKEPLRKIYTFVEMILKEDGDRLSENGRGLFKRVQAAVQRMGLLTDDILLFSELNSEEIAIEEVNLYHILKFVVRNMQEQVDTKKAAIDIGELPVIKGYRSLLSQLFHHLLSNALKFHEEGITPHITITSRTINGSDVKHPDAVGDMEYTRVSIADNGIGFEKKYASKIFGMFQRLHSSNTYSGTGIGLTVCSKIMDMHNGFITVDSALGEGSTFHCYFVSAANAAGK